MQFLILHWTATHSGLCGFLIDKIRLQYYFHPPYTKLINKLWRLKQAFVYRMNVIITHWSMAKQQN